MPAVSEAQRKAMFAAASGHSTLGIPKAVGEEFVAKDAVNGLASGIMFVAPDGDILLLRRRSGDENWAGHWDLPGGKGEPGEAPEAIAAREAGEEVGSIPLTPRKLLDSAVTPKGMAFHTFAQPSDTKFAPTLSDEHSGFAWVPLDQLPAPLHPGVKQTLERRLSLDLAGAMFPADWDELKQNFAGWVRAKVEAMPAQDAAMAFDRASADRPRAIAFDRDSVRRIDQDGHLFVEMTPISKANICPYWGHEIADAESMGLDPQKVYMLLRDPVELAKAAPTFAGKQLLMEHIPVSAEDSHREITIGAIGDDVVFEAPYLMAPLSIWDGEAIELIESGKQKELSSAYRYRADMTPGSYEGEPYDGVMRDIVGNHVALVTQGRAGPDVVVGDSAIKENPEMAAKPLLTRKAALVQGALTVFLKPKLAADTKIDLTPLLAKVTGKNYADSRAGIADGVTKLTKGKLAKDADLEDMIELLDALESTELGEDLDPNAGVPMGKRAKDEEMDPRKRVNEFLKDKLSADDMKACDALWDKDDQEAMDEDDDEEEKKKKKAKEEADKDEAKDKSAKDRKAMDAAVTKAVAEARQVERDIRKAEEEVRPYIGKIAVAMDSAAEVYKTALVAMHVDLVDVPHEAGTYRAILKAQPLPGSGARQVTIATDAAAASGFFSRFPEAKDHQVKTL